MSIAPAGLGIDSHVTTQLWAEGAGGFHPAPLPLGESGVWGKAPLTHEYVADTRYRSAANLAALAVVTATVYRK